MRTGNLLRVFTAGLTLTAPSLAASAASGASSPRGAIASSPHRPIAAQQAARIDLSDLSDPTGLERRLRAMRGDVSVSGGRSFTGDFAIGSLDTLRGHLLVLRGTATIFGRLLGNLITVDGDIVIHPGGGVEGDVLALGGTVRDLARGVSGETRALGETRPVEVARGGGLGLRLAGFAGVVLTLLAIGFGLVTFARPSLEIVSDTVTHSLGRSFLVGLLAEILVIPTFGMLVVGLALTVVGVLLIPFAVIAYGLLVLSAAVLGLLAVAHAMGEVHTRRRMARGVRVSPNGYRYMLVGLAGLLTVWVVWLGFGWVPAAGSLILIAALLVTWVLATVGFGASLLSRLGVRAEFAGRIVPPEALTDEYLWATPQMGVPAIKRSGKKDREDPGA
jgi:hypothetical protein